MKAQIPTAQEIIQPAINKLVELRPRTAAHVYTGRYSDIIFGWKAQARVHLDRLADEAVAARLPLASGDPLRELARSEYWAEFDETPGAAVGEVSLLRQITNTAITNTGNFAPGVIPAGAQFHLDADPKASPPIVEATYQTATTTVVESLENLALQDNGDGTFTHFQFVVLSVTATTSGSGPNVPYFMLEPLRLAKPVDALFDPTFVVVSFFAAGGFDTLEDETIRKLAQANYLGQFGPTDGALVASALKKNGVQHVAPVLDAANAIAYFFIADESWGCSDAFLGRAQRTIKEDACGFGCRTAPGFVQNVRVSVKATVTVEDAANALPRIDTSDIVTAVQQKLRAYFDDRPDWYTWRLNSIGGIISKAHPKILACPMVQVFNVNGLELSEPPAVIDPASTPVATHYYLADDAVKLTFEGAS
jgi:hypothetical protein